MDLLINDVLVEIVVAPFEDNFGWIMIAIIKDEGEKADALHAEIAEKIRTVYRAVMDNSSYMEEGQVAKIIMSVGGINTKDEPQVRLLECEPLRFIDMLRMLGFSVTQKVILKK